MATHSSILAWRIPQRSLVCCSPWGHKESETPWQVNCADPVWSVVDSALLLQGLWERGTITIAPRIPNIDFVLLCLCLHEFLQEP